MLSEPNRQMTPTPAWINRAAEAIYQGVCDLDLADAESIATVIAKHVPKPKPLEWRTNNGFVTHFADTPVGNYCAHNAWWFRDNEEQTPADSLDAAKAAAYADFCDKLKACYGEARE